MPQLQKKERPTPEQLNAAYRDGYMTAAERNEKMRRLAHDNLDDLVADGQIFNAYWKQTLKHVQENWDDFVKIAQTHDPTESSWGNIKTIGQAMWDQVGILTAPLVAFSEVNGAVALRVALHNGASPGLAAVIATAVETGSNFVPIGKTAQLFAKAIQENVPELATGVSKFKGAFSDPAAGVTGAKSIAGVEGGWAPSAKVASEKIVDDAIEQGLKNDGVKIPLIAAEGEAPQIIQRLTPQDEFFKSLRAFQNQMAKMSERKAHAATQAEADKLGILLDDLKQLGGKAGLNESQILAYLKTMEGPLDEWAGLAKQVVDGVPDAIPLFNKKSQEIFGYLPNFRQQEKTAGRTVEILKESPAAKSVSSMLEGWDPESMAKLDFNAATMTMAEDVLQAQKDGKLKALIVAADQADQAGLKGAGWWAQTKEVFRNLLLATPITWARVFNGNLLASATDVAERGLAGRFSIDDINGVKKGEAMANFYGKMGAIGESLKAFADGFANQPVGRFDEQIHRAIPGVIGRIVNIPTGFVAGIDNLWKTLATRGDYRALAFRKGVERADKMVEAGTLAEGKPYWHFVADYAERRANLPTEDMRAHAVTVAFNDSFQSELGKWGKSAQQFIQQGPLYFFFPFVKSGMNLVKWTAKRTPGVNLLGKSLYDDILAGGERADMAVARLTMGGLAAQFLYGLHQAGLSTAGGPTDTTLRRSWNKPSYSIMSGKGEWIPLKNVADPVSLVFEAINDFAEIHNQLDDPTAEQGLTTLGLVASRVLLDNTWWRPFGQIADVVGTIKSQESISDKAAKLAMGPITAVATGGPLGSRIVRSMDPVQREAKTWVDQARNGAFGPVFGYSDKMPYMRDGYGDPVLIPQAIGADWLNRNIGTWAGAALNLVSPITEVKQQPDRIKDEGARLQVKLPRFPWSLGGKVQDSFDVSTALPGDKLPVELTPQQRDRWQVIYRSNLRHPDNGIEAQLLNTPEWKGET